MISGHPSDGDKKQLRALKEALRLVEEALALPDAGGSQARH